MAPLIVVFLGGSFLVKGLSADKIIKVRSTSAFGPVQDSRIDPDPRILFGVSHIVPVSMRISSRFSGFLLPPKNL